MHETLIKAEIQQLNNFYYSKLKQYECSGYVLSQSKTVHKLLKSFKLIDYYFGELGLVLMVSFKLGTQCICEQLLIENSWFEFDWLREKPVYTSINIAISGESFSDYINNKGFSNYNGELAEWFDEIQLCNVINSTIKELK